MFWERTGGDSFELAVAKGSKTNAADFHVLEDGVLGWAVKSPSAVPSAAPSTAIVANDLFNQGCNCGVNLYNCCNREDFGFTFPTPPTFSGNITIELKIGITCDSNEKVYLNDNELRSLALDTHCSCSEGSPETFIFTTTSNELVSGENTLRISSEQCTGFLPVAGSVYAIITYGGAAPS
jgi:hypothetical protein